MNRRRNRQGWQQCDLNARQCGSRGLRIILCDHGTYARTGYHDAANDGNAAQRATGTNWTSGANAATNWSCPMWLHRSLLACLRAEVRCVLIWRISPTN